MSKFVEHQWQLWKRLNTPQRVKEHVTWIEGIIASKDFNSYEDHVKGMWHGELARLISSGGHGHAPQQVVQGAGLLDGVELEV